MNSRRNQANGEWNGGVGARPEVGTNKIKDLTAINVNNEGEIIQQLMSQNQYASVMIFDLVKEATKDRPHSLKDYQMKRPRLSLALFWAHLIQRLAIDAHTENHAAKLVWKLSCHNFRISNNLLYKLATVCLILAEKLFEDQTNTLESFSLVSGISMKDLKQIQVEVLLLLDFNLNLSEDERQIAPQFLTIFQTTPY